MELKDKAIDIKWKKYVLVSDRVLYFNEQYPNWSIITELISEPISETVIIKATVKPTENQVFTGYSQATWWDWYINKTSALENAETSAVGRALAFMGIWVIESIASADEIKKTTVTKPKDEWLSSDSSTCPKCWTVNEVREKNFKKFCFCDCWAKYGIVKDLSNPPF